MAGRPSTNNARDRDRDREYRRQLRAMHDAARSIAARLLRGRACTLGRTDLAHEALARLLGGSWANRVRHDPREATRVLGVAVRRALVDYERRRRRARRTGDAREHRAPTPGEVLDPRAAAALEAAVQRAWLVDRIDRGATALKLAHPDAFVEVAEACLLLGLSQREAAAQTGIPQTTVSNWTRMLRAWLRQELRPARDVGA